MKLLQLSESPEIWINVGTGAVSRICKTTDPVSGRQVPTVILNDGHGIRIVGNTLGELVQGLKAQEQDYEHEEKE